MDNKTLSLLIFIFPAACLIGNLVDLYKEFRRKAQDILALIAHSYFLIFLITLIEIYIRIIMGGNIVLGGSIEMKILISLRIAFPIIILFNLFIKFCKNINSRKHLNEKGGE
jgi:hypothetical protein